MRYAIIGAAAMSLLVAATGAQSASSNANATLTAVDGLKVGHHTLSERPTGCTVILVDGTGATGGVSQRGGAPGTRETDLLHPLNMVDQVNAIVLAGASTRRPEPSAGSKSTTSASTRASQKCPSSPRRFSSTCGLVVVRRYIRRPTAGIRRPRRPATLRLPKAASARARARPLESLADSSNMTDIPAGRASR